METEKSQCNCGKCECCAPRTHIETSGACCAPGVEYTYWLPQPCPCCTPRCPCCGRPVAQPLPYPYAPYYYPYPQWYYNPDQPGTPYWTVCTTPPQPTV